MPACYFNNDSENVYGCEYKLIDGHIEVEVDDYDIMDEVEAVNGMKVYGSNTEFALRDIMIIDYHAKKNYQVKLFFQNYFLYKRSILEKAGYFTKLIIWRDFLAKAIVRIISFGFVFPFSIPVYNRISAFYMTCVYTQIWYSINVPHCNKTYFFHHITPHNADTDHYDV